MNKIIFLDIDGVLNSEVFQKYRNNPISKEYPLCDIDPYAINLLNKLVDDTNSVIVITSVWRLSRTLEELQLLFSRVGFTGVIVGKTPRLGEDTVRGNEIYKWIKDHEELIGTKYFDDDSDMLLWQQHNFIKIDGYCGLTSTNCYKAEYILNRKY
jgi:hypothetical protein